MVVSMSLVASRLVVIELDTSADRTKPWAASLLITRLMSGKVRFCRAVERSRMSRFEVVPLAGTKPCWPSNSMTSGTLGTERCEISGPRLRVSRFEVVGAALGTNPAWTRLTM